ncbi:MAG: hypothetical protein IT180_17085 [Acidobacteria bacterium]|nr:hypothetical protein [Acidobacteriota bacterium]
MTNVIYMAPLDPPPEDNTPVSLVYLLGHQSHEAAPASREAFRNDSEWKKVAVDSQV